MNTDKVAIRGQNASSIPATLHGTDKELARMLNDSLAVVEEDKQAYVRKSFAVGLFAHWIKETQLTHGQFGPWLQHWLPDRCRQDARTGRSKASSALSEHLAFSKDVIEGAGLTLGKILDRVGDCWEGKFPGTGNLEVLLLADAKVPSPLLPIQSKLSAFVGDQTKRQLIQRFRSCDEDGNPQKGRRPGEGGKRALSAGEKAAATAAEANQRSKEIQQACVLLGAAFTTLPDEDLEATLHFTDTLARAMRHWLKTPTPQRDVKDIVKLLDF